MKPPYEISNRILSLVSSISEKIGGINEAHLNRPKAELRKRNRIQTIQSSLEIEGNTLSLEQITDLLNNKRVLAPQKDILEVKNAIKTYDNLSHYKFDTIESLLSAHKTLMTGLVDYPGKFRTKAVGILKGDQLAHVAPSGNMVPQLMNELLNYLKYDDDLLLIKGCVFHYEFEFIHPFSDGNGRIGRLWQTLILKEYSSLFEFLPIEIAIKEHQQEYYNALEMSDNQGKSTIFIEFMLKLIDDMLKETLDTQNITLHHKDRIEMFKAEIKENYFTRQDYMKYFKQISPATASRDLKDALQKNMITKTGERNQTKYKYN